MNEFKRYPSLSKPVVLITGATTGIGLSLAKELRSQGAYRLVLTARRESLDRFENEGIRESDDILLRPLDVMKESERKACIDSVKNVWGPVDILINNAGFAYRSVLEHVEEPELLQQMMTNFWGPMELIRLVLPEMRSRRQGRIINISSVGGMMAMPTMGIYSASKFALEGAIEALYYEVKPWNIHVSLIEPGFIKSDGFSKVKYTTLSGSSMRDPSEAYFGHYRFMTQFIEGLMKKAPGNLASITKKIVRTIEAKNPPLRVLGTPDAYLFDLLRRLLPRSLYHWALYQGLPYPDCWGDESRLRDRCKMKRTPMLSP